MNRLLAIATILICLSTSSYAQKTLTKGYVVQLNGDTTKGYIDYKNWKKNPTRVEFKKEPNGSSSDFTPKDIASFGVYLSKNTEIYKSAEVNIETSSNILDQLDKQRAFNEKTAQVFLLVVLRGKYNLYAYQDHKEHFFVEKGNQLIELRSKSYYLPEKNTISQNDEYKNKLVELFKDCDKISNDDLVGLAYDQEDFIKIFKKYDQCSGVNSKELSVREKAKFSFGVVVAPDVSRIKVINHAGRSADITSAGNFAAGVSMQIQFPRNNRSSSFNFELLYRHYKFENRGEDYKDADQYTKYHNLFEGNYAKLNFMYRYQWTLVKLKPFVNAGISQAFKLSKLDKSTGERKFYTSVTNFDYPLLGQERVNEQGINLGVGINVNKINIELRAETTNGYSSYVDSKTSISSLYLNLNYSF